MANAFTAYRRLALMLAAGLLAATIVGCAQARVTRERMSHVQQALEIYYVDTSAYPTTEQGLRALEQAPAVKPVPKHWRGPYVKDGVPLDGWGRPFRYACPGKHKPDAFDLWSDGAKPSDPSDDIANWDR